ncbi:MAG: TolC family protein [Candidatus Hydrogenedentales bacterium]|jgi:outer membrane protein TolC
MFKMLNMVVIGAFIVVSGCAAFNGVTHGESARHAFLAATEQRTEEVLAEDESLDLDRCIAIALEHNLDIEAADLNARLATLNKRLAFSHFLPELTFQYTSTELNKAPASTMIAGVSTTVQDRIVRETALQAQMPIFAPATWFLYAAHQRGEEIGALVADYTRQMIALQVTGLYFQSLATRELRRTLEAQRDAASALVSEVEAYHREGMVTDADLAQVRLLLLVRENELSANARAEERNLADLLTAMGLSATARPTLDVSTPLQVPEGTLDDWIMKGLLENPRLQIADRQLAIEHEKLRIAVTEFLPILAGFAGRSHTSNSFMAYPYVSAFGFTGLMTVFNGFANINEYKAARVREEQAFLSREQASLAVMLEVVRAQSSLEDAQSMVTLADAAFEAEKLMLKEQRLKMREGLLRPSEMLDRVAKHDAAEVNAAGARYQEQVMIAIARNVLGITHISSKDVEDE